MVKINALNIYLNDKRKYLLLILNILLAIFVILEISIFNTINPKEDIDEIRLGGANYMQDP
jgi:hypothetical protein